MDRGRLLLALGGAAALGVITYIASAPANEGDDETDSVALDRRKLLSLWQALVKNMHLNKYQIEQVLYSHKAQLAQQGVDIPDEQWDMEYKQQFEKVLQSLQSQLLSHFGVTARQLQEATDHHINDPEISGAVKELEKLYAGAEATEISIDKLEAVISGPYTAATVEGYQSALREMKGEGKDPAADTDLLEELHRLAASNADSVLAKELKKENLTPGDLNQLLLKNAENPAIRKAIERSHEKVTESLARVGIAFGHM